jgi:Osmosensitive K+ channel histidine kinase
MHKGFLLVSIPLFFEIGIFSLLLSLQNDMAQESARINRSRMIADSVNQISRRIMILEDSFRTGTDPIEVARNIRTGINDATKQFGKLDRLTRNDEQVHAMVLRSITELNIAKGELGELETRLMNDPNANPVIEARAFGRRFHNHLRSVLSAGLLDWAARSAREIDTDRTAAMRDQSVLLLKLAVGVSAIIAAVGALLFSQHMISRLNVVVNNAEKLGSRQELSRPIGGKDEIAELDSALHNADDLISSLEQAREEIIGMVSHDIRSPLATIKATGEMLKDKFHDKLDKRSNELFDLIDNNCEKVLLISQDLLDMQKLESGMLTLEIESTNLKECLLSAASSTLGLQRSCGVDVEPELASLHAQVDEVRIEQVVTNLLTNAIKFSPRGSKVLLTLKETTDDHVCISVVDHGPGIPDEMKATVFDRFQQVSKEDCKVGSGLGLAISKALVELHGGEIGVTDSPPTGCEFWIILPKTS